MVAVNCGGGGDCGWLCTAAWCCYITTTPVSGRLAGAACVFNPPSPSIHRRRVLGWPSRTSSPVAPPASHRGSLPGPGYSDGAAIGRSSASQTQAAWCPCNLPNTNHCYLFLLACVARPPPRPLPAAPTRKAASAKPPPAKPSVTRRRMHPSVPYVHCIQHVHPCTPAYIYRSMYTGCTPADM